MSGTARYTLQLQKEENGSKARTAKISRYFLLKNTNRPRLRRRKPVDFNLLCGGPHLLRIRDRTLAPPEVAGSGNPVQFLMEDFSRRVGVDERLKARPRVAGRVSAQDDMETFAGLLYGGFGKACNFKKAASDSGIARGVKARRGFGL